MERKVSTLLSETAPISGALNKETDGDLVLTAQKGGKEAFGELVRRHQGALYRLAYRFTRDTGAADDIVQDTFMKAYLKLSSFEGRSSFRSWLFRIAINNCKNMLRQSNRMEATDTDNIEIVVDPEVEVGLQFLQVKSFLTGAVQKLPARQKMALMLRVYDDLSFHEIANIMGCTYDTAKAHFRHAILKIQSTFRTSSSF